MVLTKEIFDKLRDGEIFATGILPNSPEGLFMTSVGGELKWVAVKGYGNDWIIYCNWVYKSDEWIKRHGDKITSESNIKKCIQCDDEIFNLYRL